MKARYLSFIGMAIAVALSGGAAWAQSGSVPKEIQLSQTDSPSQNPTQPTQPSQSQPPTQKPAPAQVSQKELQQFANAVKKLQPIQENAQNQIVQAIQQEDLSEKRFGEIYQSRRNPQAQPTAKITPDENKKFDQANAKIEKIEQSTQGQMEQAVKGEGLDIQRFNQIFLTLRQNPDLLQKVREMIKTAG
ncbi:DUF4168 domain-containing protein [Chroococcidiopsis thermalis]|uniref:DUF4168 domain-containing protein n=1 Tax=Chroococcidiopsis thermalis (strain PCC 7203) TaxID=251229 RepID=K9TUE4_CHRTP|nr:DUF4168 domain-containing protein [Chroococcidiopsis thermalis]AFY86028.1 hypothetical protein Chro_0481 [Chroococcidiopsis thermalis PCC 7203]PSB47502.1 DUF4168 domain-containing protein [Cyanosarcina cf. burmensis CCALA 770]